MGPTSFIEIVVQLLKPMSIDSINKRAEFGHLESKRIELYSPSLRSGLINSKKFRTKPKKKKRNVSKHSYTKRIKKTRPIYYLSPPKSPGHQTLVNVSILRW